MNLILLMDDDFISSSMVRLGGRRFDHVKRVHRAAVGDELVVGRIGGRIGRGRVTRLDETEVELEVALDRDPPPPLPLTLVAALPRPKVMSRLIAAVASIGVKRLFFINSWRVEKSYWTSPRLDPLDIRENLILGLEQSRDTILPEVETRRFFRRFVEEELGGIAAGSLRLAAHPPATVPSPRAVVEPVTLAVGPEGGFIDEEIDALVRCGFTPIHLGPRILRVETAIPYLIGRICGS
jgi:16S rRNA (uracil1498-N3)-methyltransferase